MLFKNMLHFVLHYVDSNYIEQNQNLLKILFRYTYSNRAFL